MLLAGVGYEKPGEIEQVIRLYGSRNGFGAVVLEEGSAAIMRSAR